MMATGRRRGAFGPLYRGWPTVVALAALPVIGGSCLGSGGRKSRETARALAAAREASRAGRAVDPTLVRYREAARLRTGLRTPRGLALGPDGLIYVVGDSELRALDLQGAPQRVVSLTRAPTCVAVEPTGALVIGHQTGLALYRPNGELEREWSLPGAHPHVTCVTPAGKDIWVADAGDRVVLRYDRNGQLLGRIGESDDRRGIPGLLIPSPHLDVVVGPKGLLLVNNPGRLALETYTADGKLVSSWQRPSMAIDGFCGCCNPTDIALLPDGRVVTSEKGLPRVKVMNPDGSLSCVVAPPDSLSAGASGMDLAVGADGKVFVLDPQVQLVRIFMEVRP